MGKTALIVVDVLNGSFKGVFACERTQRIVPPLEKLVEFVRKNNMPVIYTNDAHLEGVDKELELWGNHAMKDTEDAQVVKEIAPQKGDFVIPKRRYNAFFQTDLNLLLAELGVDTLIITGLLANICVINTVAEAYFWGYKIYVPSDCTDCQDEKDYEYVMNYMSKIYAADITDSKALMGKLK
jgi:nicotinamidase-related amidase